MKTLKKTIKPSTLKKAGKTKVAAPTAAKRVSVKAAPVEHVFAAADAMDSALPYNLGAAVHLCYVTRSGFISQYEGIIADGGDDAREGCISLKLTKGDNEGELRTLRYDRMIWIKVGNRCAHMSA